MFCGNCGSKNLLIIDAVDDPKNNEVIDILIQQYISLTDNTIDKSNIEEYVCQDCDSSGYVTPSLIIVGEIESINE